MQVVWCGMDSEIMTSLNYYALVILHLLYRCLVAKNKNYVGVRIYQGIRMIKRSE